MIAQKHFDVTPTNQIVLVVQIHFDNGLHVVHMLCHLAQICMHALNLIGELKIVVRQIKKHGLGTDAHEHAGYLACV